MRPITFLGILAGLSPLISSGDEASFVRAPYVQLATDSSIHIVWRTGAASSPTVRYGTDVKNLDKILPSNGIQERRHPSAGPAESSGLPLFQDAPAETRQFEATITGLEPESTYYYAIFEGGQRLTPEDPSYRFRTNPTPGADRPVNFWVVGDSGTGGKAQDSVHQAMLEYTRKHKRPIDLYLHVGDMAYGSGTTKEFTDRFFAMYEPTLRHTVCWPTMGNHEGYTSKGESGEGPYYDAYVCPTQGEAGGLPSGTEAYYSFDYGRVHFIVLDSHDLDRRPTGAMARWLKADLEKIKADWLVTYFHHPPYTKGSHDSDKEAQLVEMREHIMPILEGGGVDIVFTGHSHIYERSMLIDGAYATPTTAKGVILDDGDGDPAGDGPYRKSEGLQPHNGTVQVVAGHGGTGVGRKGTMPIMRRIFVENGSVLVDISGDTLTGTMLNLDGVVRDTFALRKSGTVTHTPIANPWQPAPWSPTGGKPKAPPAVAASIIGRGATWAYLAGTDPPAEWTNPAFDDTGWKRGKAGFGYADNDDQTKLDDMNGNYKTVYLRHEFTIPQASNPARIARRLRMSVSYDDAFIAYLNGVEILRVGVDTGAGKEARGFHLHEANKQFKSFPIRKASAALKKGRNVLAIEGHNANLTSSDFTLHPSLVLIK
jgi:hypothetical protein